MNYLVITPDGVGSTILQRLITISLDLGNEKAVNTHELTNGIALKNGVAHKNNALGYSQDLGQVINILQQSSLQVSLVSRIAKYHLNRRKDSVSEQEYFLAFLNDFFHKKIMCVRENIFEYALSWSIRHQSGVLNVYNREDKEKVFQVDKVDEEYFLKKCNDYVKYQAWVEKYFQHVEIISYEKLLNDTDSVIYQITGQKDTFLNAFKMPLKNIIKAEYNFVNSLTTKQKQQTLSNKEKKALILYKQKINDLISKDIILGAPIKNTTLLDKTQQIKNFKECLCKFYSFAKNHNWIDQSKATYDVWNGIDVC